MKHRYLNLGGELKSFEFVEDGDDMKAVLVAEDATLEAPVEASFTTDMLDEDGNKTGFTLQGFYLPAKSGAAKRFGNLLLYTYRTKEN